MTRCDTARRLVSDAIDDPLGAEARETLAGHLHDCPDCARFERDLSSLRRHLRIGPVAEVPDIAADVRARLEAEQMPRFPGGSTGGRGSARARRRSWPDVGRAAAVLVVAGVLGALLAGLFGPPVGLADTLGERMLRSQGAIGSLSARLTMTEHGWHPDVDTRTFSAEFAYASPDRFTLTVEDRTSYPDGRWRPNDVTVAIAPDRIVRRGPAPCPVAAQPACTPPQPRTEIVDDPEPFNASNLAPLDLVVPTGSFGPDEPVDTIDDHPVDGRATVGVEVTAAQIDGLVTTLLGTGNWRQVHPTDPVRLWLDREWLVPLEVEVLAGSGLERRRWASVHGYHDEPGQRIVHVAVSDLSVNGDVSVVPPDVDGQADQRTDGGFERLADGASQVPRPGWLPAGMLPHVNGVVGGDIHVRTWTDGRAWLKVRTSSTWEGPRLFGRVGPVARHVDSDGTVMYTSADGATVGVHGEDVDVAVTGSLPGADLRRVAASLPVAGRPVPPGWEEAATLDLDEAAGIVPGLLVPPDDPRFRAPAVRRIAQGVSMTVAGPGSRGYELLQLPGERLTPPTGADVLVVAVRGTSARYTAATGELEWVEADRVNVLRSDTLPLAELIGVADALRPHR